MAQSPSLLHGSARAPEVFGAATLIGLAFLHVWELPRLAAHHGGFAFMAAWLLCLALLALPLLLQELMLGRRARRSPAEGLAVLTREADAARGWRASGWGMLLAALLGMVAVALLAGGSVNFLARELELVDGTVQVTQGAGWVLPLGAAVIILLASGLALLPASKRLLAILLFLLPVLFLLMVSSLSGLSMAALLYPVKALSLADWQAAARLALLGTGAGLGVIWVGGMSLPATARLGRLALGWLLLHAVLGFVLLLALAPFVAVEQINASMAMEIVPTGAAVWMLLSALLLLSIFAVALLAEPLLAWLAEKGLERLPAVLLAFAVALLLALVIWFALGAAAVKPLLQGLAILVLLILLGQSVFAGWAMKISHARKELNLPAEGIYNLWRVAVRILLPLVLLWVLSGLVSGLFA